MAYIIILIVLFIIGFNIFKTFEPKFKKKKVIKYVKQFFENSNLKYQLETVNNAFYDLSLQINDNHYLIKILVVPEYSEIQINSKSTWELKYGAGNSIGKAQPHSRFINEIRTFQNTDVDQMKILLVYPKPKKIVKYINESEVIFVNQNTDVYQTHIISLEQLNYLKENGKKI